MADDQQIQGLPPGAQLKPIEGLPPGAELRPVGGTDTTPPTSPEKPSLLKQAGNFAGDVGKGLGESGVSLMSTGDQFARKHLPAFLTNSNMGFGPPADQQKVEEMSKPANATQAVSAGFGDALTSMIPVERAVSLLGPAAKAVGRFTEPLTSKLSEFNQAWNPLPLKSRAINSFKTIEDAAKDVPVNMEKTAPAIDTFRDYVNTGGRGSPVINKLGKAVDTIPESGPIKFPEARQFYSNVTTAAKKPNVLRRLVENPALPKQRFNLGEVKGAMNTDLTNAAERVGRGQDYKNALTEYRQAAQLGKLGKRALIGGGAYAGTQALKNMGLLGDVIRHIPGGQ